MDVLSKNESRFINVYTYQFPFIVFHFSHLLKNYCCGSTQDTLLKFFKLSKISLKDAFQKMILTTGVLTFKTPFSTKNDVALF